MNDYHVLADIINSLPILARFTIAFGLIVILPKIAERVGLPGVVGLLIGGIIMGPNVLQIFNPHGTTMQLFSELGKLLLMFFAGMEINLFQLKKQAGKTIGFGFLTFAIPMAVGTAVGHFFGFNLVASLLIGSLMASHTLLGLPVVRSLGLANINPVMITVGATIITDVLAMLVLAICVTLHKSGFSPQHLSTILIELAIYVPVIIFGLSWMAKQLMKRTENAELRTGIFILLICIAALLAETIELESIVGAFLAGIAVNHALGEDRSAGHALEVISYTFFIPAFFLSTGFLVDFKIFISTIMNHTGMVFFVVAGLILAKFLAAGIAGLFNRASKNETLLMWSLSVPQVAATLAAAIVAYSTTNAAGERLLSEAMLNAILVLVVFTSILGPILTNRYGKKLT
jgi:Kef-type K+ transport system membrane component KefB